MKTSKHQTVYEAADGAEFTSWVKCANHERMLFVNRFVGLSAADVEGAMQFRNKELAESFEIAGRIAACHRRNAGMKIPPIGDGLHFGRADDDLSETIEAAQIEAV